MKDGSAVPPAPGNLHPQLVAAGILESNVRAVLVSQQSGFNLPVLAAHDKRWEIPEQGTPGQVILIQYKF